MNTADAPAIPAQKRSHFSAIWIWTAVMIALVGLRFVFSPVHRGVISDGLGPQERQAWYIGQILFTYANDDGGKYPSGNSSTEIFQNLIDSNYVTDPTIFYFPFPGKIKPVPGQKLKPENVCFDMTNGVTSNDPDELPLVISTGWKIDYVPGGGAVPLSKPPPHLGSFYPLPRSWAEWWRGKEIQQIRTDCIAVSFKGNFTHVRTFEYQNPYSGDGYSDGIILDVVPKTFDPKGKTYRQLTPDGILP